MTYTKKSAHETHRVWGIFVRRWTMKWQSGKQALIWRNNSPASIGGSRDYGPADAPPQSRAGARHQRASARVTRVTRTSADPLSCRSCQPNKLKHVRLSHAWNPNLTCSHKPHPSSAGTPCRRSSGTLLFPPFYRAFFIFAILCMVS